jgi:hypothetical protein
LIVLDQRLYSTLYPNKGKVPQEHTCALALELTFWK